MSITLTPQQDAAVLQFRDWFADVDGREFDFAPAYVQQGYAGTGKTTVLPFFIEACGLDPEHDVTFVAPTGKAAKVMTGKLRAQGIRKAAVTVHKAMYRPKGMKAFALESQINATLQMIQQASDHRMKVELQKTLKLLQRDLERAYMTNTPMFQLDPEAPAMRKPARLIVCDEASMVGEMMAEDMTSFGTPVLAIGDPGQLQPVGDNPGFFHIPPHNVFTEIHRQALDNPIIRASMDIREGRELQYGSHGDGRLRVLRPKDDDVTFDLARDVQVICGTNAKRHRLTRELRKASGLHACGPSEGEMLIVCKNSRKHPSLVNGTMLMVTADTGDLEEGDVTCKVNAKDEDGFAYSLNCIQATFEENYLGKGGFTASKSSVFHASQSDQNHTIDWGYCITAHKSQGSQWGEVCVHDESNAFREQSKQWLYTAVTRAAETLTVVVP